MPSPRAVLLTLLLLGGLVLPALVALDGVPGREVRSQPLLTHAGKLGRGSPLGQLFRCEVEGLERIELALARLPGRPVPLELVLRERGPRGEVLRRVVAEPPASADREWLAFAFEPLEDARDRWLHLSVQTLERGEPSSHTPWIRYHGQVGHNDPWGKRVIVTQQATMELASPLDNLRAIAVGFEDLSPTDGPLTLRVREQGGERRVVRSVTQSTDRRVRLGYTFFAFDPIPQSAGRQYSLELEGGSPVRLVGFQRGPSFKSYHGTPGTRVGMRGATIGERQLPDRDLVFRTHGGGGWLDGLRRLSGRLGARGGLALIAWLLALVGLTRALLDGPQSTAGGRSS